MSEMKEKTLAEIRGLLSAEDYSTLMRMVEERRGTDDEIYPSIETYVDGDEVLMIGSLCLTVALYSGEKERFHQAMENLSDAFPSDFCLHRGVRRFLLGCGEGDDCVRGAVLRGLKMKNVSVFTTGFHGAELNGLYVDTSVFSFVGFDGSNLAGGLVRHTRFERCNFDGASLRGMTFSSCVFTDCSGFESADCAGMTLDECTKDGVAWRIP